MEHSYQNTLGMIFYSQNFNKANKILVTTLNDNYCVYKIQDLLLFSYLKSEQSLFSVTINIYVNK